MRSLLVAFALGLVVITDAHGQGGPPMITDDPGTPGPGKFEINLAIAFERRPSESPSIRRRLISITGSAKTFS
jgi:hypothetical protein